MFLLQRQTVTQYKLLRVETFLVYQLLLRFVPPTVTASSCFSLSSYDIIKFYCLPYRPLLTWPSANIFSSQWKCLIGALNILSWRPYISLTLYLLLNILYLALKYLAISYLSEAHAKTVARSFPNCLIGSQPHICAI